MTDTRPADPSQNEALRASLENWLNRQNQTLLEEVMAAWQGALARFHPDDALLHELRAAVPPAVPAKEAGPAEADLAAALDLIEGATSQSELLRRLLDALSPLVERSALFILKQGLATLYAHRGFEADGPAKTGTVVPPPELEALLHGQGRSLRHRGPGYRALLTPLSGFEAADAAVFPLRHKRKTVALLLADSGLRQTLDHPELIRALVLATSAVLASLAAKEAEAHAPEPAPNAPTMAIPEPIEPLPTVELDPRTRSAAERLARVLVGDVELYFPAKVAQARTQGNLYRLLRDELERSRATFVERFGEEVEARHRIFTTTVVQQLCEGDGSKLGAAPWA